MPIRLTADDADRIAGLLSIDLTDPATRDAFLAAGSIDVQAAPGSGKTTLVAAKLLAIARHWCRRHAGVCVLSHTNVAHEEISRRLAGHAEGAALARRPHFIGTFQQFVQEFLALPWLRSQGMPVYRIDNESFEAAASRFVGQRRFDRLRAFVGRRNDAEAILHQLEYAGADVRVLLANGAPIKGFGVDTKSYECLQLIKDTLTQRGWFRFRDMYAFADRALQNFPYLVDLLRRRFPVVIVDEVQDTEAFQWDPIARIFGGACVVQRFGDANQAIYHADSAAENDQQLAFPRREAIQVAASRRFGPQIARLASRLAGAPDVDINGQGSSRNLPPVLLTFDDATIGRVLPRFAEVLLDHFPKGERTGLVARAVGFRAKPATAPIHPLPYSIGDYWVGFQRGVLPPASRLATLYDYVVEARRLFTKSVDCRPAYRVLLAGLRDALRRVGMTELGDVDVELRRASPAALLQLRRVMLATLAAAPDEANLREEHWTTLCTDLLGALEPVADQDHRERAAQLACWSADTIAPPRTAREGETMLRPRYLYETDRGRVDIAVGSIHGAKGETHDATLVLETKFHEHDLKVVLPFLAGDPTALRKRSGRFEQHCKRLFVAMTRPRHLVAFAMHEEHVSAGTRQAVERDGWTIIDLRDPGPLA